MTRYYPLLVKELYPTPESRPRQHETLIELYRKGQFAEALRLLRRSTWKWWIASLITLRLRSRPTLSIETCGSVEEGEADR